MCLPLRERVRKHILSFKLKRKTFENLFLASWQLYDIRVHRCNVSLLFFFFFCLLLKSKWFPFIVVFPSGSFERFSVCRANIKTMMKYCASVRSIANHWRRAGTLKIEWFGENYCTLDKGADFSRSLEAPGASANYKIEVSSSKPRDGTSFSNQRFADRCRECTRVFMSKHCWSVTSHLVFPLV